LIFFLLPLPQSLRPRSKYGGLYRFTSFDISGAELRIQWAIQLFARLLNLPQAFTHPLQQPLVDNMLAKQTDLLPNDSRDDLIAMRLRDLQQFVGD
jgi:hypothetical protein